MSQYENVLDALKQRHFQAAIVWKGRFKDDSGVDYGSPKWVLSRKLIREVTSAISSIRTHIHFGDQTEPLQLPVEPVDIGSGGTHEEQRKGFIEAAVAMFSKDPIDKDPQYAAILDEVDQLATAAHKDLYPEDHGFGFCHNFWRTKKALLKEKYGIDWKSPAEWNPGVIFDEMQSL